MASAGGRFFGFVTGGALPVTVVANWLATAWDQNASFVVSSPANAALEIVSLRWLKQIFDLPPQSAGGFVTCATAANFSALAAARHELLARAGWGRRGTRIGYAPPLTVVVGDEVHASVQKALSLAGFGRDRVIRVPVDAQGRMRIEKFPSVDDRTIVCVQAGNVNTGAFDPIAEICARSHAHDAWVHVDGASWHVGGVIRSSASTLGPAASRRPTPGLPTPTNGSMFPMTAAWYSRAMPMHYAARCPLTARISPRTRSACRINIRPTSRVARAESRCGLRCANWVGRALPI